MLGSLICVTLNEHQTVNMPFRINRKKKKNPFLSMVEVVRAGLMESDEALREAACIGNLTAVKKLINNGISINSQNVMNGW